MAGHIEARYGVWGIHPRLEHEKFVPQRDHSMDHSMLYCPQLLLLFIASQAPGFCPFASSLSLPVKVV